MSEQRIWLYWAAVIVSGFALKMSSGWLTPFATLLFSTLTFYALLRSQSDEPD